MIKFLSRFSGLSHQIDIINKVIPFKQPDLSLNDVSHEIFKELIGIESLLDY